MSSVERIQEIQQNYDVGCRMMMEIIWNLRLARLNLPPSLDPPIPIRTYN